MEQDEQTMNEPVPYRRRPVNVEAWRIDQNNIGKVVEWCKGSDLAVFAFGQWIIRQEDGVFASVDPETFQRLFEAKPKGKGKNA